MDRDMDIGIYYCYSVCYNLYTVVQNLLLKYIHGCVYKVQFTSFFIQVAKYCALYICIKCWVALVRPRKTYDIGGLYCICMA